jgi:RNA-directed DNA polymerase
MVRREEAGPEARCGRGVLSSSCAPPTGESPVPVSAGAPGSRPPTAQGESLGVEAGCQKPLRREPQRGPQRQVKPAASTDLQRGSRAAHVTAKAKSVAPWSGGAHATGSPGVGGAARVEGGARNTRGPSAQPSSRQGDPYKPKAKSGVAQRESEGIVVPEMGVKNNAPGGKGPCGGYGSSGGKREGMAGKPGPNHPTRSNPRDKVRQLQRCLYAAAKRQPGRRFHALMDRIYRGDVLWEAWRRVRKNRGAAGVDAQTLVAVEQYGVERFLEELGADLRAGAYRPQAVLRRYILKGDGRKQRPLGIPTVRDRVVQMAAKLVLEPIFEADFCPCSYGFRPRRSATEALETLRKLGAQGYNHVLDADLPDYFGSIDQTKLMKLVERRISDRRVLKLLRQWLRAGVMEEGVVTESLSGTPQGGVISPLLSNIYLNVLDTVWEKRYAQLGVLVRYADDFVVVCRTRSECEQAEQRVKGILARLSLVLHPEKTRRLELSRGKEGFDFLGCHLRKRMSGPIWEKKGQRVYFLQRWPSQRSMKRVRQRIKELTPRGRCHADLRRVIAEINPVLRGWGNYFRTGNAANQLISLDRYVGRRLKRLRVQRAGRSLRPGQIEKWHRGYFEALGLVRLRGTTQYPEAA